MRFYVSIVLKNGNELDFHCPYTSDRDWLDALNAFRSDWVRIGDYIVKTEDIDFIIIREVKEANHESL